MPDYAPRRHRRTKEAQPKTHTSVRLDADLWKELRAYARSEDINLSSALAEALDVGLQVLQAAKGPKK